MTILFTYLKNAVRIVSGKEYLAHTEPICKELKLIKVSDIYSISIWKLCYKLMRNILPAYFNFMKLVLPNICAHYQIRRPLFHLPRIKHKFAEQLVEYQLIQILNKNGSIVYASRVQTH